MPSQTRFIQPTVLCLLFYALIWTKTGQAEQIKVAVAANFYAPMKHIAEVFEQATGHRLLLSFGSTGKLYAQIIHGAPYSVFLAADQARPAKLVEAGQATGRITYAIGKLVLWSKQSRLVDDQARVLQEGDFSHLAIGNPKTAPYGAAAWQVIQRLGLKDRLQSRLVYGDSIAQTHQFVATGNAQLGFVALAQVGLNAEGSRWEVPQELYEPIRQDVVLLNKGKDQEAALALMRFLESPEVKSMIAGFGYGVQ